MNNIMCYIYTLLLIISFEMSNKVYATQKDTTYLYFSLEVPLKFNNILRCNSGDIYPVHQYVIIHNYIQPPIKRRLISENTNFIDTISVDSLSRFHSLKNLEQISTEIISGKSFTEFFPLFLVERDNTLNGPVTITEVFQYESVIQKATIHSLRADSIYNSLTSKDTVLYLLFEPEIHYKSDSAREINTETMKWYPVNRYTIHTPLFNGYPLDFISEHLSEIDTVSLDSLRALPVTTCNTLKQFIKDHYGYSQITKRYYGAAYFNQLKHIYLVEIEDDKKKASITEVDLNIQIE